MLDYRESSACQMDSPMAIGIGVGEGRVADLDNVAWQAFGVLVDELQGTMGEGEGEFATSGFPSAPTWRLLRRLRLSAGCGGGGSWNRPWGVSLVGIVSKLSLICTVRGSNRVYTGLQADDSNHPLRGGNGCT